VFVNSMSDLFHARVPLDFVRQVFQVMADTPQHTYQVLTKRARRLRQVADRLEWPAYPSRYTTRPSRDPVMPPNCGMYRPSRLCTTLAREALTAASEE
jgi:hypothetical protein